MGEIGDPIHGLLTTTINTYVVQITKLETCRKKISHQTSQKRKYTESYSAHIQLRKKSGPWLIMAQILYAHTNLNYTSNISHQRQPRLPHDGYAFDQRRLTSLDRQDFLVVPRDLPLSLGPRVRTIPLLVSGFVPFNL